VTGPRACGVPAPEADGVSPVTQRVAELEDALRDRRAEGLARTRRTVARIRASSSRGENGLVT